MQGPDRLTLPQPDPDSELARRRCHALIAERIERAGGMISFAEYMHLCLYAPGAGYYTAGNVKFGPAGDFVTAPEVSSLFGYVVARRIAPVLAAIDEADVLEFGAGSGKLAADVLDKLEALGVVPRRYRILEVSADLVERQRALLTERVPQWLDRVQWIADWPEGHRGVVLANEVLDALAVERFVRRSPHALQQCVAIDGERFVVAEREAPEFLAAEVDAIETDLGHALAEGYVTEVSPAARHWINDLGQSVAEGLVMLFDYGLPRREYYAAERSGGWLRCHFRHRAHNDPLILSGIQDITSWVDFTAVAMAAVDTGFRVAGYSSQAEFLLGGGLAEEMSVKGPEEALALSREIKLLTLPGEMGEHFKCLGLLKGATNVPELFEFGNRLHRL